MSAPVINYAGVAASYPVGSPITLTPTNTGGLPKAGTKVNTFSGNKFSDPYPTNGVATATTYKFPSGIATLPDGTSYVVDEYGPIIRKITPAGVSSILAGSWSAPGGIIQQGHVDGTGAAAQFGALKSIAVDAAGNAYVPELGHYATGVGNYIRKVTPTGVVTTIAGNGTAGSSDNANPLLASFKNIQAITVAADGTIYIADTDNNRIRKIATNGAVTTVAGSTAGNVVGNVSVAKFKGPRGIAVDSFGNIFVSDTGNAQVKKIDTMGNVTVIVASPGIFLGSPVGLVYTGGNLYVADEFQHFIYKIDTLSNWTIYSGNGIGQYKDGISMAIRSGASFYAPQGLAADGASNITVADRNSMVIRKIEPQPAYTVAPSLPAGLSLDPLTGVVSGTPTVASARRNYTVTAINYDGLSYGNFYLTIV